MDTSKATPRPWLVFEGGNFVQIVAQPFQKWLAKHRSIGGPFVIADANRYATEDHGPDHQLALANAELIVAAVNLYDPHRELLEAAREYRKWTLEEYKDNPRISARMDAAIKNAESVQW